MNGGPDPHVSAGDSPTYMTLDYVPLTCDENEGFVNPTYGDTHRDDGTCLSSMNFRLIG